MSAHDECGAVGKFDCWQDERIHELTVEFDEGEGNVEGPAGWFMPLDLEDECEGHESLNGASMGASVTCDGKCQPDWVLVQHYGTRHLIARENGLGQWWVECYDTEQARDERLEALRAAHAEWDTAVLS